MTKLPMPKIRSYPNKKGVSLVELILVVAAVFFLALLVANLPSSIGLIGHSRSESLAKDVAGKKMDELRRLGYASLANGQNSFTDPALNNLAQGSGVYEVSDCPVEVCTGSEEMKKVVIMVRWQEKGQTQSTALTTLISEGGIGQ